MSQRALQGKIAVVTGGSRGLGRATALRLAKDGALVAFNYRSNSEAAQETLSMIKEAGGDGFAVQADLSSLAGVEQLFEGLDRELQERSGSNAFDILVNNAGIIHSATIQETEEADFDRLFDLNVKGVFFTVQRAIERLRDNGRVVMLSSGLARFSYPQYIAYAGTKGANEVFTRYLAATLGSRGITVNTVAPGAIDTDMNPYLKTQEGIEQFSSVAALHRIGHAEDISDVIAFLASDDSRWVTGQRIEASGGAFL